MLHKSELNFTSVSFSLMQLLMKEEFSNKKKDQNTVFYFHMARKSLGISSIWNIKHVLRTYNI